MWFPEIPTSAPPETPNRKATLDGPCLRMLSAPTLGKRREKPQGLKGEEEELVGEGKNVLGVSVAKTPYLSHALPVPGLECGTWTPVPGQASGPGLGRGGVLERPSRFSKPKTGTDVEAHEDEISYSSRNHRIRAQRTRAWRAWALSGGCHNSRSEIEIHISHS